MNKEYWKDIKGYEGLYQISNLGRLRNRLGKIMKPYEKYNKYLFIRLCKNSIYKNFHIHRLVAEAFIENPYNLPQVNHKDEDKSNNCVDNLEWCTAKYNVNYGTGLKRAKSKISKPVLQYTLDDIFVAEYPSTREASRSTGLPQSHISDCCRLPNIKKAYGFKWKFKTDDTQD